MQEKPTWWTGPEPLGFGPVWRIFSGIIFQNSVVEITALYKRKGPSVGPFPPSSIRPASVVAASNATGHDRSIRSMDFRDLHRAVSTCICSAYVHPNARAVVATPVVVTPAVVTIAVTPAILSGRRRSHCKQRQRCNGDKSCLHAVFSSGNDVQRFLCFGVPKQLRRRAEHLFRVPRHSAALLDAFVRRTKRQTLAGCGFSSRTAIVVELDDGNCVGRFEKPVEARRDRPHRIKTDLTLGKSANVFGTFMLHPRYDPNFVGVGI
jgi:hypothetical protein